MDPKDLQDLVVDYLYDELDPEQRAAFEAALPGAPEVREEVEAFQRTRETFSALEDLEVPAGLGEKLIAEAARVAPPPPQRSFLERLRGALQLLVMHPAMSAAAVMVAVLGVSLYVYRHGAPPSSSAPEADPLSSVAALPPSGKSQAATPAVSKANEDNVPAKAETRQRRRAARKLAQRVGEGKKAAPKSIAPGASAVRVAKGGARAGYVNGSKADSMRNVALDRRQQGAAAALGDLYAKGRGSRGTGGAGAAKGKGGLLDQVAGGSAHGARFKSKRKRAKRAPARRGSARRPSAMPSQAPLGFGNVKAPPKPKAPNAAKPQPGPSKEAVKQKKTNKTKGGAADKAKSAQRWLRLGHSAVASKRCPMAFDYYTRALRENPALLSQISAQLGSCRAALRRAKGPHAWLRGRIHGQERRSAPRKARRRRVMDQRQEAK